MARYILGYAQNPFSFGAVSRQLHLVTVIIMSFFLSGFSASDALAATIYVDANGGTTGNGSSENPFGSISRASAKARPGDTVLVRSGIYSELVVIKQSGNKRAPITIQAERSGKVIIDGAKGRGKASLVDILGSNIIFEGFQVKNASRTGIALWGTQNVIVRGNTVSGSKGAGIWVGHDRRGISSNNIIENNIVVDNCRMNTARNKKSGWPIGIAIAVSDKTIVRRNKVYNNFGEGIGVLSSVGVSVIENVAYDNFSVNVYLDNAPSTKVTANLVGSTGNRTFFRHGRSPDGVLIANEVTRHEMQSQNIYVAGNTLVGTRDVYYGTYGRNSGLRSSVIGPNDVNSGTLLRLPSGSVGS